MGNYTYTCMHKYICIRNVLPISWSIFCCVRCVWQCFGCLMIYMLMLSLCLAMFWRSHGLYFAAFIVPANVLAISGSMFCGFRCARQYFGHLMVYSWLFLLCLVLFWLSHGLYLFVSVLPGSVLVIVLLMMFVF